MNKPRDLPNQHGFKFIGVIKNGDGCRTNVPGVVVRDPQTGCHYTEGVKYCDLIGWQAATDQEEVNEY